MDRTMTACGRYLRAACCAAVLLVAATAAHAQRTPLLLEGKETLYLRVLARPFSNIYAEKDAEGTIVRENVPAFAPFFVYAREGGGETGPEGAWYEVGEDEQGSVLGYMRGEDVLEWRQTICLSYTHPEGRMPVLMFERKAPLLELVNMPPEVRRAQAKQYYNAIEAGQIPKDFPVESIEPAKAIDMSREFYLLPILDHQPVRIDGREARLVQLAAATAGGADARESGDIRENPEYLAEAVSGKTELSAEEMAELTLDVVWVMDTTVSMKPFIQKTLDVIRETSRTMAGEPGLSEAARFGVWGYRDPEAEIPGIGYTTKNYTPELLPIDGFVDVLAGVDVTEVDSVDYEEDVFSGMDDALRKTPWREDALRVLVLVGDAPGHGPGHPWNVSQQSTETLRTMADDRGVFVYSVLVEAPRFERYHGAARRQFQALAANPGMAEAAYVGVDGDDLESFASVTAAVTEAVQTALRQAAAGQVAEAPASGETAVGPSETAAETAQPQADLPEDPAAVARDRAGSMVRAAVVRWIGSRSRAKAPRDVVAYALDKDLMKPVTQSLDVRVLLTKRQLDTLYKVCRDVLAAGEEGQFTGLDFFESLRATAAAATRDPDRIANAKTMVETGMVPEFLEGLPYTSRLMGMTSDLWMSWSIDEQDEFLAELGSKLAAYEAIHDSPDGWVALTPDAEPGDHVYPLSLDLLP